MFVNIHSWGGGVNDFDISDGGKTKPKLWIIEFYNVNLLMSRK